jgi:hypothetical protein
VLAEEFKKLIGETALGGVDNVSAVASSASVFTLKKKFCSFN